jgi:hypothetical protein
MTWFPVTILQIVGLFIHRALSAIVVAASYGSRAASALLYVEFDDARC